MHEREFFLSTAVDGKTIMTQYRNPLENVSLKEKGISINFHVHRMILVRVKLSFLLIEILLTF